MTGGDESKLAVTQTATQHKQTKERERGQKENKPNTRKLSNAHTLRLYFLPTTAARVLENKLQVFVLSD